MNVDVDRLLRALGISAKRAGREWQALCPYHQDRKPSWSIRDQPGHDRHGRHNCFSCGAGGDALRLAADLLGITRDEATEWLAVNGVTSDPDIPFEVDVQSTGAALQGGCVVPAGVQVVPFDSWPTAPREYAERDRGITAAQVARWGIGFAVVGRCRGRVWMPIRNAKGELVSWMARAYDKTMQLRYLTPRREEAPGHDAAIFGSAHWRTHQQLVVCEGALNALACERAGAPNVAAIGGSVQKVTPLVIAQLSAFAQVLILTDSDDAGDSAAALIEGSLKRWREVVRLRIEPKAGKKRDANDLPEAELREILLGRWQ